MLEEQHTNPAGGETPHAEPRKDDNPLPVAEKPRRPSRLLVVEDAECTRRLICALLGKMGVEAEGAKNGQMACEMAEKSKAEGKPYDVILMDIHMPQMSGYEATRWLREHGWERPIVAVTAYTENGEECVAAGCDDHLAKPITEAGLRNAVERHLNGTPANQWAKAAG
jgi:CheY-like chemotaxis protein